MIISSQRTRDQKIVDGYITRIEAGETFQATIVPLIDDELNSLGIDGMLIDGHHRMEAYEQLGLQITFAQDDSRQAEIEHMGIADFLEQNWMDCDWYDIATGQPVF